MSTGLNRLEVALLDPSNEQLELYIEDSSNVQIRADIEAIRLKAAGSNPSGLILEDLRNLIKRHHG